MRKVIGNLFLVVFLFSFVCASSMTSDFVINEYTPAEVEVYVPHNYIFDYVFYIIGALVVIGVIVFLKCKHKKKHKKISSKKKVQSKKAANKKKVSSKK
jgi:dipeptide/tripeptide permease